MSQDVAALVQSTKIEETLTRTKTFNHDSTFVIKARQEKSTSIWMHSSYIIIFLYTLNELGLTNFSIPYTSFSMLTGRRCVFQAVTILILAVRSFLLAMDKRLLAINGRKQVNIITLQLDIFPGISHDGCTKTFRTIKLRQSNAFLYN
ncbi:hypothetical protein [Lederbergia lenta]|uniref:hypothetical protein n=1 Tax=Lederbergia lenta TaxID=1467 RepID=UPI00203B6DAE|nr:hypothetical protein [Lederbergia lenta]MCM3111361.1 hypothetical protein [Lederbergia lenta]